MRGVLTTAAVGLSLVLCSGAGAAPEPQPFGTGDAGGFRNVLPPGQDGHADVAQVAAFLATEARPPHAGDQLAPYTDLISASPTLDPARLEDFFKDATFGVEDGEVEHTYSPRGDVTIQRDRGFGVPHIYGSSRDGAMFGAGYIGAEDRLFLMDALRHVGRAELSTFVGGSEGNREMDREQWRIAPYTEADLQRQVDQLDDLYGQAGRQVQEDVGNYVAGINKYICPAMPVNPECIARASARAPPPARRTVRRPRRSSRAPTRRSPPTGSPRSSRSCSHPPT